MALLITHTFLGVLKVPSARVGSVIVTLKFGNTSSLLRFMSMSLTIIAKLLRPFSSAIITLRSGVCPGVGFLSFACFRSPAATLQYFAAFAGCLNCSSLYSGMD